MTVPNVSPLFWALVHSTWQGAAAALVLAACLRFWLVTPHARLRAAMAALFALPLGAVASLRAAGPLLGAAGVGNATDPQPLLDAARGGAASAAVAPTVAATPWPTLVVGAWALGVALVAAHHLAGQLWLRRAVARRGQPLAPDALARGRALAARAKVARVRFVALATDVPFTYGWLRAVVVVPTSLWAALPAAEVDLLLLHELVHVRRRDYLHHAIESVVGALFFYHPAVWWMRRVIERERERACDAEVVELSQAPRRYARALVELAARRPPAGALAATGGDLRGRVRALVEPAPRGRPFGWLVPLTLAAALAAACTLPAEEPSPASAAGGTTPAVDATTLATAVRWLPAKVARHGAAIAVAAAAAGLDPAVVELMVLVESAGNPAARSPTGATGLMQLMPETAAEVGSDLGLAVTPEDLVDPELNLRLGCHHVAALWARFADAAPAERRRLVWASYNAGSAAVDRHLAEAAPLPEETTRYVALLEALHAERDAETSTAYAAWRARIQAARRH